jgi:phage repressor protein C with HTH and peptisase S24 domain
MEAVARMSPVTTIATPYQAVEFARQYVREHPASDFAIGIGDSMLPLYQDHDVIILERPALSELKLGQTVVFMGGNGVPVAHLLVNHTARGWSTMGMNNSTPDAERLSEDSYVGVVVRAYHPTGSPILAYWRSSPQNLLASNL